MDKDPGLRSEVARQIIEARDVDRRILLINDRGLSDYKEKLMGVNTFINYILKNKEKLGSSVLLDIGAGTTRAAKEIKDAYGKRGLEVLATTLTPLPEIKKNLGRQSTYLTSAERLYGIKDGSVAGIISVFGLAYSKDFEQVEKAIDRVLVPGGIFKGSFGFEEEGDSMMSSRKLERILNSKGYDVWTNRGDDVTSYWDFMVAIKPPALGSAKKILEADFRSS